MMDTANQQAGMEPGPLRFCRTSMTTCDMLRAVLQLSKSISSGTEQLLMNPVGNQTAFGYPSKGMLNVNISTASFTPSELKHYRRVAEGTTSTISLASLHTLKVAVKSLKPLSQIEDPLTRQRACKDFENELLINTQLRHPNIVLLIGCVRSKELHSLIFEYSNDGVPKCSNYGIMRLADAIQLCLEVGRALCYAHCLGIVHRDVKPSQVLMFGDVAKLGDWGLATRVPLHGCRSGETGTWEFMAPEVIRSEPYNENADVYSFGMLLFCFVMGNPYPYSGNYLTPLQAAMGVVKTGLRPHISSQVPDFIKTIITSCWEAEPHARPKMADVLEKLHEVHNVITSKSRNSSASSWSSWIWGFGS